MNFSPDQIMEFFVTILTYPGVTALDKVLMLFMIIFVMPYILVTLKRILIFAQQFPNQFPDYQEEKKKKLKNNLPSSILRNKIINSTLEKMVYEASAGRASLFQFHNGGENIRGIPFIKFSVTNEWCPISIPRESHLYKDVPIGIFSGISYQILQKKKMYFPDVEDLRSVDSGSYAIFKSKNVESVYVSGIFDLQDSLLGLVVLECFEKVTLDTEELYIFEKNVGLISGLVLCKDGQDPNECSFDEGSK